MQIQASNLPAMQTILGAGGAIGVDLAKNLSQYSSRIRLVSRNPLKVNPQDEIFPADITDKDALDRAVAGSEVVYLTAGFEYNIQVWKETWPSLMDHLIDSCERHGAKLVFFDNVYMYDRDSMDPMTEDTLVKPSSKKGWIRAEIAEKLMNASKEGRVKALIARSADFLAIKNSVTVELLYKNMKKGKRPMWFASPTFVHSLTYTPDAAKAVALLGNTESAYGQVWHLPTTKRRLTIQDWANLFARELGTTARIQVIPGFALTVMSWFNPLMKELKEMNYQNDRNYFFDSTKFDQAFGELTTPPEKAVKELVIEMKKMGM